MAVASRQREAQFEATSYGFRPGRSCHDAIKHIKSAIQTKAKYVLDADIAKCFDRINHNALLHKLNYKGKVRRQIKAWLKSGVLDKKVFSTTNEGTPQGGVASPLLANIALHGLVEHLYNYIVTVPLRNPGGNSLGKTSKISSLTFIRYADDFVVLHSDKTVIINCRDLISRWLSDIGLELKPSKTRLAHTFLAEESEDGIAGFNFLGFNISQRPAGKYNSAKNPQAKTLGFNTFIIPTKEGEKRHQDKIGKILKENINVSQAEIISLLNPIIRGWTNYYKNSDAKSQRILSRQDYLTFLKLRRWAKRSCKSKASNGLRKYWRQIADKKWAFATKDNSFRLLEHQEFAGSSNKYVKVRGDKSPYDGDLVYWSSRMGRHPEMPQRKAFLLKQQKGFCPWCNLKFREEDILEIDHIQAFALGGKDEWQNLQLLHGHCHDKKTAEDLVKIRELKSSQYFEKLAKELMKLNYMWIEDIPVILNT